MPQFQDPRFFSQVFWFFIFFCMFLLFVKYYFLPRISYIMYKREMKIKEDLEAIEKLRLDARILENESVDLLNRVNLEVQLLYEQELQELVALRDLAVLNLKKECDGQRDQEIDNLVLQKNLVLKDFDQFMVKLFSDSVSRVNF